MPVVLQLRPDQNLAEPSNESLVSKMRELLADAEAGRLTGLCGIAQYRSGSYHPEIIGEAFRRPTTTLGMLMVLEDEVKEIIRNGS